MTILRNVQFNMPAESVKSIDQLAKLELISRADWARRAVLQALVQATRDKIAKENRR